MLNFITVIIFVVGSLLSSGSLFKNNLVLALSSTPTTSSTAIDQVEDRVVINFFYSYSCPHCAHEAPFVEQLAESDERVELHAFEVSQNRTNAQLLGKLGEKLQVPVGGVPFTAIGTETLIGYRDDETTGQEIKNKVEACLADYDESCQDQLAEFLTESNQEGVIEEEAGEATGTEDEASENKPLDQEDVIEHKKLNQEEEFEIDLDKELKLPFVGQVKLKTLSLPVLTFLVALLDGFNPCAMWVLVFLISLLLGMKDRRRMWILGTAFILTSGLVYFLFLSAWLNLFLFLGFVFWVRTIVALVALGAGIYCLYDFFTNKDAACKVTKPKKRQQVFSKLKELVKKEHLWGALVGIVLLAFAVNLVELVCSAGLPAVFTQVLSLNELPTWKYYSYLIFYVVIFMLDDMFVFVAAMVTLRLTGIETKYARFSRLIGGFLMVIIGLLLILKPEWLMFG